MTDISLHFSPLAGAVIGVALGWPGLVAGGILGAPPFEKRRALGGAAGAVAGCVIVFFVRVLSF